MIEPSSYTIWREITNLVIIHPNSWRTMIHIGMQINTLDIACTGIINLATIHPDSWWTMIHMGMQINTLDIACNEIINLATIHPDSWWTVIHTGMQINTLDHLNPNPRTQRKFKPSSKFKLHLHVMFASPNNQGYHGYLDPLNQ